MFENANDEGIGQYIRTLKGKTYDPLTKKEEKKLLKRYKLYNDTEARNKLIKSNLRYAFSLATKYRGRGLSYMELLSEANDGLIESIDKFDSKYDIKLFSYSKWWILQRMQSAIEKKIKTPHSVEIPGETFDEDLYPNEDNEETNTNDNTDNLFSFEIEENAEYEQDNKSKYLQEITKSLTERELDMINRYFGRGYEKSMNLEEIGHVYSITKERVRQIISNSLRKIRVEALLNEEEFG